MKMGIEKKLREYFPNLSTVTAAETSASDSKARLLTVESLSEAMEGVMPAVVALGGTLVISRVDAAEGVVYIKFKGPPRLQRGVELVLKDNKLVKSIVVEPCE